MSKKILLFDNELIITKQILKETDWVISVLITRDDNVRHVGNPRIKSLYAEDDFWNNFDLSSMDFEVLKSLWHAQLKIENCTNREIEDYQMGKWSYYRGFSLVKKIFDENEIDFVIVKGPNHGYVYDRLITDMATYLGVNNYNIETTIGADKRTIYNNLKKYIVSVDDGCDVEDVLFKASDNKNTKGQRDYRGIKSIIYKYFGLGGIELWNCFLKFDYTNNRFDISIWEKIAKYRKFKLAQKYYASQAVELDIDQKYICYALSIEPEAAVAGMAEMDSQIAAIGMLASSLPQGWKLYVKEHPGNRLINREWSFYGDYFYSAGVFKTKRFYKEIHRMKNVHFLKSDTNMRDIIKNSCAMATMIGTVSVESVQYNKPVLLFAPERTIYKYIDGYYCISSYSDCKKAIEDIAKQSKKRYGNFNEICKRYLIDFSDQVEGSKRAIKAIKNDMDRMSTEADNS